MARLRLQQDARFEPFPIWFSYSGKDEPKVAEICDLLGDKTGDAVKNCCSLRDDIPKDIKQRARLVPQKYQWETKDINGKAQFVYRLMPNNNIDNLVLEIATNLLRVVVISESYFQSPVCLKELCMCLCANYVEQHSHSLLPMLLFIHSKPEDILQGQKLSFKVPVSHKENNATEENLRFKETETSLASALKQTHDFLRTEYASDLQGFLLEEKEESFFQEKLNTYEKKLFVIDKGALLSSQRIYEYAFDSMVSARETAWNEFIDLRFEEITADEKLNAALLTARDNLGLQEYAQVFAAIEDMKSLNHFLEFVSRGISNKKSQFVTDEEAQSKIGQLCSLAILKSFKSISPSLIPYHFNSNSLIKLYSHDVERFSFINQLYAGLAFSIATGQVIEFDNCRSGENIDAINVRNAITDRLPMGNANSNCTEEFCRMLKTLANFFEPSLASEIPLTFDELMKHEQSDITTSIKRRLREHIEDMQDLSAHQVVLVISTRNRREDGDYLVLTQLYDFLNKNEEEKLYFPVIELRQSNELDDEQSMSAMFSERGYSAIRKALSNIFKHFSA